MPSHIIRHQVRENAKFRLFCFAYAGGSAAVYRQWPSEIPPEIEVCAVEIPGRIQLRTPLANNMTELLDAIMPDIEALLDKPFAFFAHSFGSIIAYEVTKRLQKENKPMPVHLFVSARRAPFLPLQDEPTYQLPDEEFIETMQHQYNAIPQVVLNEKELLKMLLPILKADIKINEIYVGELDPLLTIPLTVFYGTQDRSISLENLQKWCQTTQGECELISFEAGHFFIDSERKSLIEKILKKIKFN